MKTTSKTITTLWRLLHCHDDDTTPEHTDSVITEPNQNTTSEQMNVAQHRNLVECHPEEIDDIAPLAPNEADDYQLAEFFCDHDFSFLFEPTPIGDQATPKRKQQSCSTERTRHTIP